jgi:hypothetical protein
MEKEKAIDKIKKLLRMKRGGTTSEVETALQLAQKIAAEHDIDINSIDPNDESKREPITHLETVGLSRMQIERKYAAMIIDRFFKVKAFGNKKYGATASWRVKTEWTITFVGTKTNIEIAKYVYNFLVKHFQREWNTKRGRLRNRQAFMYGMYQGLFIKLAKLEPIHKAGLILRGGEIEKYMNDNFGETQSTKITPQSNSDKAQAAGYIAGKNTEIRKAVNEGEVNKRLLLGN